MHAIDGGDRTAFRDISTMISGGAGPPLAKLLSNRGRRAAGHSLLLSQEASPTSKDRAPCKTLEGQGNADESEKK